MISLNEFQGHHYPSTSEKDLLIMSLILENESAYQEIVRLATMIVALGYDPTIKPK